MARNRPTPPSNTKILLILLLIIIIVIIRYTSNKIGTTIEQRQHPTTPTQIQPSAK